MRLNKWSRLAGDRIESAFLVGAPLDRYPAVNERFSNNEAYYGSGEGRYSYRQVCNPTKSDITQCQGDQGILVCTRFYQEFVEHESWHVFIIATLTSNDGVLKVSVD